MNRKLKSFGLIESLVASFVVLVVIGAAVALATSSTRTSSKSISKIIASDILAGTIEEIIFLNNAKLIDFKDQKSDGKIYFRCLDTGFLSSGQDARACTGDPAINRLSPYYSYIVRGDNFDSKSIKDEQILVVNSFGKFNLSVKVEHGVADKLVANLVVSWKDAQGDNDHIDNQIILTQ